MNCMDGNQISNFDFDKFYFCEKFVFLIWYVPVTFRDSLSASDRMLRSHPPSMDRIISITLKIGAIGAIVTPVLSHFAQCLEDGKVTLKSSEFSNTYRNMDLSGLNGMFEVLSVSRPYFIHFIRFLWISPRSLFSPDPLGV